MNFYTMACAIGVVLGIIWVTYLLAARAYLRSRRIRPNALFTVFTVGLVILLMVAAYRVSDHLLAAIGMANPKDIITFRRIWLVIWAVSMLASIQIFIDIRRMAERGSATATRRAPTPPGRQNSRIPSSKRNRNAQKRRG
jgi:hypothetical protein